MLLAAAGALAIAIGAMIIGSRRKTKEPSHPLRGALSKRMRLFGGLTDRCFEKRELCGAQQLSDSFEEEGKATEDGRDGKGYQEMV